MTSKNLAAPHQAENPTPAKFKIILVACCMLFICFNEQSGIYCPEKTLLKPNLTGPGLLMEQIMALAWSRIIAFNNQVDEPRVHTIAIAEFQEIQEWSRAG